LLDANVFNFDWLDEIDSCYTDIPEIKEKKNTFGA
jgi:hypothetical protein